MVVARREAGINIRGPRIAKQKGLDEEQKPTPTFDSMGESTSSTLECTIWLEQLLEQIKSYPRIPNYSLSYRKRYGFLLFKLEDLDHMVISYARPFYPHWGGPLPG